MAIIKKTNGSKAPNMDAVEAEINKLIEQRNKEMTTIENLIAEAKAEAAQAEEELNAATMAGDTAAYSAAKAKWRSAEDSREMHTKRVEALRTLPLIGDGSRAELSKKIKSDIAQAVNSNTAELLKIGARLYEIRDSEFEIINRGNDLLERIHWEVMLKNGTEQADKYTGPETWRKLMNGVLRGSADIFGEPPKE